MAKKRAFVKYTKEGKLIPGSLIVTTSNGYPVDGLYTEVPTNICCDTDIPGTITSSPKGWVRYTKKGAIVPGSLIVGKSYPKDGVWKEVVVDLCCLTESINTVVIGSQTWTTRNLDVERYRNGDIIPEVQDQTEWDTTTEGAWCYYNNDPANGAIYGKLYNSYAVNDPRGLAPVGYHVPLQSEWDTLINYLGGETTAGGRLKETGLTHWQTPNIGATNDVGFNGLPGGWRAFSPNNFLELNQSSYFWASINLVTFRLAFNNASSLGYAFSPAGGYGAFVRLIKD